MAKITKTHPENDLKSTATLWHSSTHCLAQTTCSLKVICWSSKISSKLKFCQLRFFFFLTYFGILAHSMTIAENTRRRITETLIFSIYLIFNNNKRDEPGHLQPPRYYSEAAQSKRKQESVYGSTLFCYHNPFIMSNAQCQLSIVQCHN